MDVQLPAKLKNMDTNNKSKLTIKADVLAPIDQVWDFWIKPESIVQWCHASDDWHATHAENDLQVGGKFLTRMEAKDVSFGFDFEGIYEIVKHREEIQYVLADDRKVKIIFESVDGQTRITETFDAEEENPLEMQQKGWQAILNNFKKFAEEN